MLSTCTKLPNPDEDGITHINVYSKGRTELGRFLSNFARCPIVTEDGPFASIEGYWYWLGTPEPELRSCYGYEAKRYGKQIRSYYKRSGQTVNMLPHAEFRQKIAKAMGLKLKANPEMLRAFCLNTLPLAHYYVYGGVAVYAGFRWILHEWAELWDYHNDVHHVD